METAFIQNVYLLQLLLFFSLFFIMNLMLWNLVEATVSGSEVEI